MDSLRRRFFYVITIGVLLAAMYFSERPQHLVWLEARAHAWYYRLWIEKEFSIAGLQRLDARVIEEQLPLQESNLWWQWNPEIISASLRSIPLVRSAEVTACEGRRWGCFVVSVEERNPAYYALLGNEGWLIGDDGGIISAVPAQELAYLFSRKSAFTQDSRGQIGDEREKRLPLVTGVWSPVLSPDFIRERFRDVPRILHVIEDESGFMVRTLTFRSGSDFVVHFEKFGFDVTFDLISEPTWNEVLRDKVQRFSSVVRELGTSVHQVKSIDLAFSHIAVVKTNSDLAATPLATGVSKGPRLSAKTEGATKASLKPARGD